MSTRWTGSDDATKEIGWVAREARALSKLDPYELGRASERVTELISRKRALLAYVEQERRMRT